MAQQDDLIGLIKDVSSQPATPMKQGSYGKPTSDSIAAGYGGGPNNNKASPDKIGPRYFFQDLPPEIRSNANPADPGGGLDVVLVCYAGGPDNEVNPVDPYVWPVKGAVIS